ncbi:MAG: hypothetical protein M1832_004684 [Thelocarpon impressellum]|nr:MAG: hypothetical protein M1832_004684 [Thelocarpon impressellum]
MRLSPRLLCSIVLAGATSVVQASSWGFDDATVSVQAKGGSGDLKEKSESFDEKSLPDVFSVGPSDTLKVVLTAKDNGKAKRPHQAFLSVRDVETDLEASYPLGVKESGKGKVELTLKDLPAQFVKSSKALQVKLLLGSFGSSKGLEKVIFTLEVTGDQSAPAAALEKPLRYGKLGEIHHIFRADPTSPPKIISIVFTAAVLGTLPLLFGAWLALGANANHLSQALGKAAVPHTLFFGSIIALEGIFVLYYTSWNLFQTLPAVAAVGTVAFFGGIRALSEVQERRLAGAR